MTSSPSRRNPCTSSLVALFLLPTPATLALLPAQHPSQPHTYPLLCCGWCEDKGGADELSPLEEVAVAEDIENLGALVKMNDPIPALHAATFALSGVAVLGVGGAALVSAVPCPCPSPAPKVNPANEKGCIKLA